MSAEILMPKLGLNMTEGILSSWSVEPGQVVARGDVLFVVETDKITTEIEAVGDGEIVEIMAKAGATVPVGAPVARWTGGPDIKAPPTAKAAHSTPAPQPRSRLPARNDGRVIATPYARRRARELGIDIAGIDGSGPGGRIKADDVEKFSEHGAPSPAPIELPQEAEPPAGDVYWLTDTIDAGPAMTLLDNFNLGADSGIDISTVIAAAVACAHDGPILLLGGGEPRLFPRSHARRLGDIAAGIDAQARLPVTGERAGAVRTGPSVPHFGSAVFPNTVFTLGIGGITEIFRPDAAGNPALRREVALTLSAHAAALIESDAEILLARIGKLVETPALLLLGRVL